MKNSVLYSDSGISEISADRKSLMVSEKVLMGISLSLMALWMCYVWSIQKGVYLDDDIGHFLVARDAFKHPELIFSFWGRTVFTLLIMPFAPFGLSAARCFFLFQSIASVLISCLVARELRMKQIWLLPILFSVQPWFFNGGHQLLTEVPVMLFSISAVFLAMKDRCKSAAFLVGCLPLLRHETVALLGCWILFCLYKRDVKSFTLLFIPMILVNLSSYLYLGGMPFSNYLRSSGTTLYGQGAWGHFVFTTIELAGLPICMLAILGFFLSLKRSRLNYIVMWYSLLFLVNTIIYRFGLYSSGGFGIFLFPLIPLLGLLSLAGINYLFDDGNLVSNDSGIDLLVTRLTPKVCVALLLIFGSYQAFVRLQPKEEAPRSKEMSMVADYLSTLPAVKNNSAAVLATNVWLYFHLPLDVPYKNGAWNRTLWSSNRLTSTSQGDLVVWDKYYSERWNYQFDKLNSSKEYELIKLFEYNGHRIAAVFRRV